MNCPISSHFLERFENEDINILIEEYFASEDQVENMIKACDCKENLLFNQAIMNYYDRYYDIAILGLIATLDRLLSEYSKRIPETNIKLRCDEIVHFLEENENFTLDDLEKKDYLVYLTYANVLDDFGKRAPFNEPEPRILNRHWIMHGRSNRIISRLDCVKVLSMIYGTVRIYELGNG